MVFSLEFEGPHQKAHSICSISCQFFVRSQLFANLPYNKDENQSFLLFQTLCPNIGPLGNNGIRMMK